MPTLRTQLIPLLDRNGFSRTYSLINLGNLKKSERTFSVSAYAREVRPDNSSLCSLDSGNRRYTDQDVPICVALLDVNIFI
jgi:hypothetical protein